MRSNNAIKGRIVESIVAALHKSVKGTTVKRNVQLPAKSGAKRTREIDVLLTGNIGGWPIRVPIECKNYRGRVGAPKIDEFAGKLRDVGLACEGAIFVSAQGFTRDALDRAREEGIRPLEITGLSKERLAPQIFDALGSTIYLLPIIAKGYEFDVEQWFDKPESALKVDDVLSLKNLNLDIFPTYLFDQNTRSIMTPPEIIRAKWINGEIRSEAGQAELEVTIGEDLELVCNHEGLALKVKTIKTTLDIHAYVLSLTGKGVRHSLIDPVTRKEEKMQQEVEFPSFKNQALQKLQTEAEIEAFTTKATQAVGDGWHFVQRVIVPRVYAAGMYWPLSSRDQQELRRMKERNQPWDEEVRARMGAKALEMLFED